MKHLLLNNQGFSIINDLPVQVLSSIVIVFVLCLISIIVGLRVRRVKPTDKTPVSLVPFIMIVQLVNNFTKANLGRRYKIYAPYILTLGLYLLIANISSVFLLVPPTSYLVVNFALAIISFFIIQITGICSLGIKEYLKSFVGPVPALAPLIIPINIIGELALPISLSLRLVGNLMSSIVLSKLILGIAGWGALPVMPFFNVIFDIGFAAIQVIVFVLLTVIFTSMKISDKDFVEEK